ncbi:MAG: hypothetical protein Q4A71_05540 [Actinomycetaceae bacterium]|nr:hypothetical protein [Actinomycetaceae bacterium]
MNTKHLEGETVTYIPSFVTNYHPTVTTKGLILQRKPATGDSSDTCPHFWEEQNRMIEIPAACANNTLKMAQIESKILSLLSPSSTKPRPARENRDDTRPVQPSPKCHRPSPAPQAAGATTRKYDHLMSTQNETEKYLAAVVSSDYKQQFKKYITARAFDQTKLAAGQAPDGLYVPADFEAIYRGQLAKQCPSTNLP